MYILRMTENHTGKDTWIATGIKAADWLYYRSPGRLIPITKSPHKAMFFSSEEQCRSWFQEEYGIQVENCASIEELPFEELKSGTANMFIIRVNQNVVPGKAWVSCGDAQDMWIYYLGHNHTVRLTCSPVSALRFPSRQMCLNWFEKKYGISMGNCAEIEELPSKYPKLGTPKLKEYILRMRWSHDGKPAWFCRGELSGLRQMTIDGVTFGWTPNVDRAEGFHCTNDIDKIWPNLGHSFITQLGIIEEREYYPTLTFQQWSHFVEAEVMRARKKHPGPNNPNFAALVEEVGEVAKVLMENPNSVHVLNELIQVAAVAYRLASEGDVGMKHSYHYEQLTNLHKLH